MSYAVRIHHMSKSFGERTVLRDVSMDFVSGQIYGITGMNGSGKSMLLKCIAGLISPTSGSIEVFGKKIGKDVDFAPSTGIAIDRPALLMRKNALENMYSLSALLHKPNKEKIRELLKMVGLQANENQAVRYYSAGMKQRLNIAMALLDSPQLLLLDEPFSNMDIHGVQEMQTHFKALAMHGMTIIIATHIVENVEAFCNDIFTLSEGSLIANAN